LKETLKELADDRHPAVPQRFREKLTSAWSGVQTEFEEADSGLATLEPSQKSALREVGLTGDQLLFKLSIFNYALAEYRREYNEARQRARD
jgi:hypothetical protein